MHMFYNNIVFCCIGVANKLFASQTLAPLATACPKGTIQHIVGDVNLFSSLSETMPKASKSWTELGD